MELRSSRAVSAGWLAQLLSEAEPPLRRGIAAELGLSKLEELEPDDRAAPRARRSVDADPRAQRRPRLRPPLRRAGQPRALGLLGYLARHSATIGEAVARVVRFQRLIMDASDCDAVFADDGALTIADGPQTGRRPVAASPRRGGHGLLPHPPRRVVGRARPRRIGGLPAPRAARPLRARGAVRLSPALLPAAQPDRAVGRDRAPAHARRRRGAGGLPRAGRRGSPRAVPHPDEWVERLVAAIEAELGSDLSLASVAERLHVGRRTLQRRIAELGLELSAPRRFGAAPTGGGSRDPRLGLEEITERLGFADPSGFRRLICAGPAPPHAGVDASGPNFGAGGSGVAAAGFLASARHASP